MILVKRQQLRKYLRAEFALFSIAGQDFAEGRVVLR